jgi:hypothetical protein
MNLREHFVHDAVKAGVLKLVPVARVDNVADLLTNPLPKAAAFLPGFAETTGLTLLGF